MKELVNFVRTLYHKIDMIVNDLSFEIIFVMGNSSCDLDSVVSSILLAYYKNLQSKAISYTNQNEITYNNFSKVNKLYIPVINCPKGELFWRLDIAELLKQVDLEENDFFYYADIWDSLGQCTFENNFMKRNSSDVTNKYSVILVDHHELDAHQKHLSSLVNEIYDHHNDDDFNYNEVYPLLKIIKTVFPRSSAVCLILEDFLNDNNQDIVDIKKTMFTNENFFDIILGAIFNDSFGFSEKEKNKKWVKEDRDLVDNILAICNKSVFFDDDENVKNKKDNNFYITYLYNILHDCKFDIKKNIDLGIEALFLKDRKSFIIENPHNKNSVYAMYSSLTAEYEEILKKYGETSVSNFLSRLAQKEKIDVVLFGSRYQSSKNMICHYFPKQGVFAKENILDHDKINNYLSSLQKDLSYDDLENNNKNEYYFMTSKNKLSRKIIFPIFEKYFSNN